MFVDTSQHTSHPSTSSRSHTIHLDRKGGVPSAISLREALLRESDSDDLEEIVIDCRSANHIDAAVLQVLLSAEVDLRRRGKALRLSGICVNVASQLVRDGIEVRFSGEI